MWQQQPDVGMVWQCHRNAIDSKDKQINEYGVKIGEDGENPFNYPKRAKFHCNDKIWLNAEILQHAKEIG